MNRFKVLEEDIEGDSLMKAVGFRMKHLKSILFSRLAKNLQVEVIEELNVEDKVKFVNVTSEFREYLARKRVTDARRECLLKAVGFGMNNLKSIPFSRLPGNLQVEVIEELDVAKKIELVNVTSGFRGYLTRNGIFGGHVDSIYICFTRRDEYEKNDFEVFVTKGDPCPDFDFFKDWVFFRKITSCTQFRLRWNYRDEWSDRNHWSADAIVVDQQRLQQLQQLIKKEENVNKIAEWFPNLRFVEELIVPNPMPIPVLHEVLESFHFKVTRFADIYYQYLDLPSSRHWEHLLANHLSICENLFFRNEYAYVTVPEEIPGMEIENDPKKRDEILDAFKKFGSRLEGELYYRSSEIKSYRRKIDQNKEMIMIVQVAENYFPCCDERCGC